MDSLSCLSRPPLATAVERYVLDYIPVLLTSRFGLYDPSESADPQMRSFDMGSVSVLGSANNTHQPRSVWDDALYNAYECAHGLFPCGALPACGIGLIGSREATGNKQAVA